MAEARPIALLTLIRHAESKANVDRVLQGVTDAPLSPWGELQLEKLEQGWRSSSKDGTTRENLYDLPRPTLIVTSPIGRARRTSGAVARGCGFREVPATDTTTHRSEPCVPPTFVGATVLVDAALSERNFGMNECTRSTKKVPGYDRPPVAQIGCAESNDKFRHRVVGAGRKWLAWLEQLAAETTAEGAEMPDSARSREATPDEQSAAAPTPPTPLSDTDDDSALRAPQVPIARGPVPIPHLVLVTHGQWIHSFLSHFLPHLRRGADAYYIKSNNTSLFTIEVYAPTHVPRMRVRHHNDTRHLGSPPAKKRKVQSTTLTSLWRTSDQVPADA